jgi:hypothetical protein
MFTLVIFGKILNINLTYLAIGLAISLCIYMYFFAMANPYADFSRYFKAIKGFIALCILAAILVIGYFIGVVCVESEQYLGLIVPIGWFFICYSIFKKIVKDIFQIPIKEEINKYRTPILMAIMTAFFTYGTCVIFSVVPDTAHQPYGPIPLILVGILFLMVTIVLYMLTYVSFKINK